jgi:hypothetical protein
MSAIWEFKLPTPLGPGEHAILTGNIFYEFAVDKN